MVAIWITTIWRGSEKLASKLRQAHGPTEVEYPSTCKKRKLVLIYGNEYKPFASNSSRDSHLLISLYVLVTSEDNPQGNQEKAIWGRLPETTYKKNY